MLWTIGNLPGYEVRARDGLAGHVRDLYFSDDRWDIRYVVVDLGGWLRHQRVLLPPEAVEVRDPHERQLLVSMSRAEILRCPRADSARPVSIAMALRYRNFVTWPALWVSAYAMNPDGGSAVWPVHPWPQQQADGEEQTERHLRSARAIMGHHVLGTDLPIGEVRDFALTDDWRIEDLIVETGSWLHHQRLMVAPYWVQRVSWEMSSVFLSISSEAALRMAASRLDPPSQSMHLQPAAPASEAHQVT
ncbi:MAG TPA: PRC-barrel domain-containing protein [Dehalococcoidia bacterium]|jgi:hypothetical protein|nr:PRC-barrel domain-containing protein [Dehalococcoidia bacterium]